MDLNLQSVFDDMPAMVGYWDNELRNQFGNRAFSSWFGLPPEQIRGMHIRDVIGENFYQVNHSYIEGAIRGEYQRFEFSFQSSDGKPNRHALIEYHPHIVGGLVLGFFEYVSDISETKFTKLALKESEAKFQFIAESTSDGIIVIGPDNVIGYASPAYIKQLGYSEHTEIGRGPDAVYELIHPEDRDALFKKITSAIESKMVEMTYSFRAKHKSGHYIWREDHAKFIFDHSGEYCGAYVICREITERKKMEQDVLIAATAFEIQDGLMVTDQDGVILRVNKAMLAHTGYSESDLIGKTPSIFKSGRHNSTFYSELWKSIRLNGYWQGEIWDRRKNGAIYPKWMTISAVRSSMGVITHFVSTHVDISDQKVAESTILNLAFYDPLTQLANRRLLIDRLHQAVASSSRTKKCAALLLIDLDHFKVLNDSLGHSTGDRLLQQVAERLKGCVRSGDTVARLGGDEFVVVLEDLSESALEAADQTRVIAEAIIHSLGENFRLDGNIIRNTPSIGATLLTAENHSVDELLKQADIAMYQVKKEGRNALRFFDPHMQITINARVELEERIIKAFDNNEFQLHFQLQVDSLGTPLGAESLIRWNSAKYGFVSPAQFIPFAEESGLIHQIGEFVLDAACLQLKSWQNKSSTKTLILAVNVSAKQFHHPDFVYRVNSLVKHHCIDPSLLKLELTESMLVANIDDTIAKISTLKLLGIRFSLDDFGTGYSSLQYLKKLPVDQLKIDQSFVRNIEKDKHDRAIVKTIISMAKSMGMEVIAEGVETESQRELLLVKGCTQYQGYLFSKPVPIEQFESLLEKS